jgi:hypothetical protein
VHHHQAGGVGGVGGGGESASLCAEQVVASAEELGSGVPGAVAVLLEVTGTCADLDRQRLEAFAAQVLESELVDDAVISQNATQEKVLIVLLACCTAYVFCVLIWLRVPLVHVMQGCVLSLLVWRPGSVICTSCCFLFPFIILFACRCLCVFLWMFVRAVSLTIRTPGAVAGA